MSPILIVGATLLAGISVIASTTSKKEERVPSRREQGPAQASQPQSYIVTPIAGKYVESGQELSNVEAVNKIIV